MEEKDYRVLLAFIFKNIAGIRSDYYRNSHPLPGWFNRSYRRANPLKKITF